MSDKPENVDLDHYDDLNVFTEYSNDMQDFYENTEEHNLGKRRRVLRKFFQRKAFVDMIADIINNKKLNLLVIKLFIGGRKLTI